jgi:UPF0755 protein
MMENEPRSPGPGASEDRVVRDAEYSNTRAKPQSPKEALQPDVPPTPPKSVRRKRRPVLSATSGFLSFLVIASVVGALTFSWAERRLQEPGPLASDTIVNILPGTDLPEIIGRLEHDGIIDDPLFLNLVLLVEGNRSKVKAGEYLFKQNTSLRAVIDTLVGGRQILHAITIPEGLTSEQVVERLRASEVLAGEIAEIPKEGSLLPETYKVVRGTPRTDIVKKMQDDHKRAVDQIWARRSGQLPLRSPYELVTLASIVEKETGKAEERPHVASVFVNRLQRRMRLQSDPTIVYGLVGGKGTLGRGITRSELERPTSYNTYTIDGLPPGPIANPGRAALDAVANPTRTQDLYFVADGTGGHVFAETLEQHAKNVQKWRAIERAPKEQAESPDRDVDRAAPQVLPPAGPPTGPQRSDRRGAVEVPSAYGALPSRMATFGATELLDSTTFSNAPAARATAKAAPLEPEAGSGVRGKKGGARSPNPISAFTMGPGLDSLGLKIRGVDGEFENSSLDGPVESVEDANRASEAAVYGPPPERRAGQEINSSRDNVSSKANNLSQNDESAIDLRSERVEMSSSPDEMVTTGPKIYDASEGTKFDPLANRKYDLDYPKILPTVATKKK